MLYYHPIDRSEVTTRWCRKRPSAQQQGPETMRFDIEETVREYQQGIEPHDRHERIFQWSLRAVRNFFLAKGASYADSLDLTQQVCIKLIEGGLDKFRGESRFRSYVFSIARNQLYAHYGQPESQYLHLPIADSGETDLEETNYPPTIIDRSPSPHEVTFFKNRLDRVKKILSDMPRRRRACFEKHVLDGLKIREVAAEMYLTTGAVSAAVHAARKELRRRLDEEELPHKTCEEKELV